MCAFPTLLVQSIAHWRKATLLHTVLQCTVHTAHWRKAHSIAQWRKGIAWDRLEQLYLSGTLANSTVYILLSTMCGVWKHPSIIHKWSGSASSRSLEIYIQNRRIVCEQVLRLVVVIGPVKDHNGSRWPIVIVIIEWGKRSTPMKYFGWASTHSTF